MLKAYKEYRKKLSPVESRRFAKIESQSLDILDKLLMHFGIKLDNYEEIKRSGIDYLHNNLTIISKRLELIALQENTRGYSSGKNLSKGYSKLLSAQQVLLAEIEELEGKYSLADIEREKCWTRKLTT